MDPNYVARQANYSLDLLTKMAKRDIDEGEWAGMMDHHYKQVKAAIELVPDQLHPIRERITSGIALALVLGVGIALLGGIAKGVLWMLG